MLETLPELLLGLGFDVPTAAVMVQLAYKDQLARKVRKLPEVWEK
jgi:hypothetical protein